MDKILNSFPWLFFVINKQIAIIPYFLSITYTQNTGAAFNIFEGAKMFLIVFSFCAMIGIVFYALKKISKLTPSTIFPVSLLLAGIACNTYERINFGYVIDFINLKFINFPIFNISDIFINLSVLGILFIIIKNSYFKKS